MSPAPAAVAPEGALTTTPVRTRWQRWYFPVVTTTLLMLTLWSFSDNLLTRVDQPSNHRPHLVLHGLCALGWMLVLCVQAQLVRVRRVPWHRTLGVVGGLLAAGVVVSTVVVFIVALKPWSQMPNNAQANRLLLLVYAIFVGAGLRHRARPDHHRRYLLLATLTMLEPVLGRAFDPLDPWLSAIPAEVVDPAWMAFFLVTWTGLIASLWGYDRIVDGRIHAVTWRGTLAIASCWAIALLT